LLLVFSGQISLREDMPLHRVQEVFSGRARIEREFGIQRIELEEVTMRSARRTRAAVANLIETVRALTRDGRGLLFGRNIFGQLLCARGEVVQDPVCESSAGRIRVNYEEGERPGLLRHAFPLERRRDVIAVTGVLRRYHLAFRERAA